MNPSKNTPKGVTPPMTEKEIITAIADTLLVFYYEKMVGYFMCPPYGLRDMCMISLGLLALNGYGCRIVGVLAGSVCNIGWRIAGRQAIL